MLKNKTFLMLALLIPFLSSAPAELKAAASLETPGINASEVEKESQTEKLLKYAHLFSVSIF